MTATAQFSRPIIVGIVYLAAIVRFLTSLARRKETKPALNQHGSYRKLLVKRRLVKVMSDILIQMDMPQHCFNCSTKIDPDNRRCNIDGHVFEETLSKLTCRRDEHCPLIKLPEHGDLVDADELRAVAYERGKEHQCVAFVDPIDITLSPVIVPSNKEETE